MFGVMFVGFNCANLLTGVPGGVQGPDGAVYFIPRASHFVEVNILCMFCKPLLAGHTWMDVDFLVGHPVFFGNGTTLI